jgi:hypothetical protein
MDEELDRVRKLLRSRRDAIEGRYGLRMVGIVGSLARGEAAAGSDVDVVADVTGRPTLFDLSRAERELAADIGRPVDLVLREAMRPRARRYIERDLVQL